MYEGFVTILALVLVFNHFYQRRQLRRRHARHLLAALNLVAASVARRKEYRAGLQLARREAIHETMECARQIVQSYGPPTVTQLDRDHICGAMDFYEKNAQ